MNRLCSYVLRYINPVVRDRVISENAEPAGFPQFGKVLYTHNMLECGNAMLKNWIGFKEKDVDSFTLDLKEMVMREEDDVAGALAGLKSPYEVLEEFCPFVSKFADNLINPDLSEQERKRRKAKMLNANFSDVLSKVDEFPPLGMYDAQASVKGNNIEGKDMLQFDRLVGLGFSEPMINSIKTKAHKLVAGGLVTRAFSGDESHSVKSFFSNKPHLVQPHKHFGYQCDDSYLQYKANKVCAHTVAAAQDKNKMEEHTTRLLKASPKGRLEALCTGKPRAGKKKSHKQKRKRRRSPAQSSEEPTRASVYLWRESCHPFLITRKQKRHVRKFPGCCKEFDKRPSQMDITVVHREKDWRTGTDKVTAVDNPRGYHLDLLSIRARHPEFLKNPETPNLG